MNINDQPLKWKISISLLVGMLLLLSQIYYYHILLMIAGFALVLYAFFQIKSAEGEEYSENYVKPLMRYPLIIAAVSGVIAFLVKQNILFTVFSMIGSVGLYTLLKGKVLLNFTGYKVYSGFYAYVTGFIFFALGAGLALLMYYYKPVDQEKTSSINYWITTEDKSNLLAAQSSLPFNNTEAKDAVINIDTAQQYQSIDGFGYALPGDSAMLMHTTLSNKQPNDLLKELFLTSNNGIGISYLRVSIGASDLDERNGWKKITRHPIQQPASHG